MLELKEVPIGVGGAARTRIIRKTNPSRPKMRYIGKGGIGKITWKTVLDGNVPRTGIVFPN